MEKTYYLQLLEGIHNQACTRCVTVMSKRLWMLQLMMDVAAVTSVFCSELNRLEDCYNLDLDKDVDYAKWAKDGTWASFREALNASAETRYDRDGKQIAYDIVTAATSFIPSPEESKASTVTNKEWGEIQKTLKQKKGIEEYRALLVDLDKQDFVSDEDLRRAVLNSIMKLRCTLQDIANSLSCTINANTKRERLYEQYRTQYLSQAPFPSVAYLEYKKWEESCYEDVSIENLKDWLMLKAVELLKCGFFIADMEHTSVANKSRYAEEIRLYIEQEEDKDKLLLLYSSLRTLLNYVGGLFSVKNSTYVGKYLYDNRHRLSERQIKQFFVFIGLNEVVADKMDEIETECSTSMPNELATAEAMGLWKKAQDAGYVDENYMPILSMRRATVLAAIMGEKLNLDPLWKPYEALWKGKNLANDYSKAKIANYYADLHKEVKKTLE